MYMVFVPFFIKKMKYFRQSEPEAFERDSQHEGAKTHIDGVSLDISITTREMLVRHEVRQCQYWDARWDSRRKSLGA